MGAFLSDLMKVTSFHSIRHSSQFKFISCILTTDKYILSLNLETLGLVVNLVECLESNEMWMGNTKLKLIPDTTELSLMVKIVSEIP